MSTLEDAEAVEEFQIMRALDVVSSVEASIIGKAGGVVKAFDRRFGTPWRRRRPWRACRS